MALFPLRTFRGIYLLFLTGGAFHRVCHPIASYLLHQLRGDIGFSDNLPVHDPVLPDDAGQRPGIDTVQPHNALVPQKGVKNSSATKVGRGLTPFSHNIGFQIGMFAFKIRGDDSVVPDEREGLYDNLSIVAGVGERLQIPGHRCGEDNLSRRFSPVSESFSLKDHGVFQNQKSFLFQTEFLLSFLFPLTL